MSVNYAHRRFKPSLKKMDKNPKFNKLNIGTCIALLLLTDKICQQHWKRSHVMNNDRIEGNWKEMKGKIQQKWGKLTDDDMDVIDGRREELIGKIQQTYGKSRDEAEKEVDGYLS
jgi:uncharacterized protein YjbJ (UPF0337 family)